MENLNSEILVKTIKKAVSGDKNAQYNLYNQYAKAMYNLSYRLMNSREDAEDILQEAFTEAFAKLQSFRFESTFGAWIKRIVVNKCINEIKKNRLQFTSLDDKDFIQEDDYLVNEPKYTIESIHKAFKSLADGYRVIFSLYMFEGYDHQEISQILNISESTSKSQFLRAKKKIVEIIKNN